MASPFSPEEWKTAPTPTPQDGSKIQYHMSHDQHNFSEKMTQLREDPLQDEPGIAVPPACSESALIPGIDSYKNKVEELTTSLARAEEALKRSHDLFSSMIELSPVGIFLIDSRLRLQKINPAARHLFIGRDDVVDWDWREIARQFWSENVADEWVSRIQYTLSTGEPYIAKGLWIDHDPSRDRSHYDWEVQRIQLPDGQHGVVIYITDISQHTLAQQALRQSEEKFRATFNQAAVGIATTSLEGRIEEVNQRFSDIVGYGTEELSRMTVHDLTHPDDREKTQENLNRLLSGSISDYVLEKRYIRKNGMIVWCMATVTLLKDEHGQPERFLAVIEDITSRRKNIEASLRLSAVVESSDDAIISKTLEGIITSWNRGAQRMFGYEEREVIGKSISILFPADRLQEEREILTRLRRGERIDHYETERIRKDGTRLYVSLTVSVIKDGNNQTIGVSKIARDITERKRAEKILQDEAKVLELLNKTGTQIAAKLDLPALVQTVTDAGRELSGAQFGAFFYKDTNEAGETLLLYALSGATVEDFEKNGLPRDTPVLSPAFYGQSVVRIADIRSDSLYQELPPHFRMQDGPMSVRSYLAVPVVSRSKEIIGGLFFGHSATDVFTERCERLVVGIAAQAAIAIDNARLYEAAQKEIMERKRAEAALKVAQEKLSLHAEDLEKQVVQRTAHLNESIQSLESVCYTIAHDLRAPLRAVQGFVKIILEDYAPSFDEDGRYLANRVVTAATRMDVLIRDLLEYAKISHMELPCQALDLDSLLQKVVDNLHQDVVTKDAKIIYKSLPVIWGNQTIVEQIFTNLLSNALKFVPDDQSPKIDIWSQSTPTGFRIFVKDNGIGVASQHQERIFEMFQRLHDNEKKYSGTGVGLAIVKKGVERIGGRVGLVQVTNGSCFYLDFQAPKNL